MNDRPKLTLKKPLSLEKQSQLFQTLKSLTPISPKKLTPKEQDQIMQEARKRKRESINATLKWLQETYPNCFKAQAQKPLKIKIEEDLFKELPSDQSITKIKVRQAIAHYTRNRAYLKCLLQETHRYDLQGYPVQKILPKHKTWAQEKLDKVLQSLKAKKQHKNKPVSQEEDNS